jgi:hypothetical protein
MPEMRRGGFVPADLRQAYAGDDSHCMDDLQGMRAFCATAYSVAVKSFSR